ncbi:MAG: hypothetical protein N5P05_003064 [Chroococcopsis gigantea SAG 12.99]|jgi:hypothetical protein|nr:PEP-CTERM sorting domain-containing protein [Chlorogloea purpurea SAG 13.99]MDV3001458.1 hypothetical protein [Chroococcopsis gigantea SAG 12.99]
MKNAILGSVALLSFSGAMFAQVNSAQALTLAPNSTYVFNTSGVKFTSPDIFKFATNTGNPAIYAPVGSYGLAAGLNSSTGSFAPFGDGVLNDQIKSFSASSAPITDFLMVTGAPGTFQYTIDSITTETDLPFFKNYKIKGFFTTDEGMFQGEGSLTATFIGGQTAFGGAITVGAIPEPFTILGAATAAAFGAAYKRKLANKK